MVSPRFPGGREYVESEVEWKGARPAAESGWAQAADSIKPHAKAEAHAARGRLSPACVAPRGWFLSETDEEWVEPHI